MADSTNNISIKLVVDAIDAANAAKTVGQLKKESQSLVDLYEKSDIGSKQFKMLGKAIEDVDKKIVKNQKGINSLGESFEGLNKNFTKLSGSIPGVTEGMEGLNSVMLLSPWGAVAAAIGLVVAAFVKTEPVMDKIKEGFNIVSSVIGVVIERLGYVASAVMDFFAGHYDEASKNLHKAIDNIGGALGDAVDGAEAATKGEIELEKAHIRNTKQLALLNKQLQKQKTLMREQGKDQKKYAKEAIATQKQITDIKIEDVQLELSNFENLKKGRTKLSREELQEEANLQAKLLDVQSEGEEASRRAQVEVAKIEEEERKKQEKAIEKSFEDERVQRKASIDLEADSLQKKLELFDLESEKEEEQQRKAGVSEVIITENRNKNIAQITKEFYDAQEKLAKEAREKEKKAEDEARKKIRQNHQTDFDLMKNFKVTQQQIDDEFNKYQLANADIEYQEFAQLYKDDLEAKKKAIEDAKEAKKKAEKEAFDTAKSLMTALNDLDNLFSTLQSNKRNQTEKEKEKAAKKEFNIKKGLGIVDAAINTAIGITKALDNPFPLNIIQVALTAVAGAAQIAAIAAKKYTPGQTSGTGGAAPTPNLGSASTQNTPQTGGYQPSTFFGLGQAQTNQRTSQTTQKVVVTTTDINNAQSKVALTANRSKIH